MTSTRRGWLAAFTIIALGLVLSAEAQEAKSSEKTQRIDIEGIIFEAPASWKSIRSASSMRKAELRVSPVEGDSDPAELILYVFPGGAGTTDDNIKRWQEQFTDDKGGHPSIERSQVQGQNTEVTRAETNGTYRDPFQPGGPKENYRLLGAIVQTNQAGYFLKMVGPDKTMQAARPGFDQLIKSIQLKK